VVPAASQHRVGRQHRSSQVAEETAQQETLHSLQSADSSQNFIQDLPTPPTRSGFWSSFPRTAGGIRLPIAIACPIGPGSPRRPPCSSRIPGSSGSTGRPWA
jgi:hypothetical protein